MAVQQKWKAMLHEAGAITENIVNMADAQQWRLQGVSVYVSVCRLSAVLVPMPCLAPPQPPLSYSSQSGQNALLVFAVGF